jgi:hypothetical protein
LAESKNWFHKKKAFRLVTTLSGRSQSKFDLIPKHGFWDEIDVLRLYGSYRQAQTPTARDLNLRLEDKLSYRDRGRRIQSYIFNARVHDFRKYLESNDVGRLVARNIRYNLGGKIGPNIRKTYENKPRDFWYFHNGLTLICDEFEESHGEAILKAPSVINGAQTLYAISGSSNRTSPALVTTRVIVRDARTKKSLEDDEWIQNVIESVNSQNKVQAFDLRSNDPEQIQLQTSFRDLKVYYERKRGEWREIRNEPKYRGFDRLSLKLLGQILTAVSTTNGEGVLRVKKGSGFVFAPENYKILFPSRKRVVKDFARIYLSYRLFELLRNEGYLTSRQFRKYRHAFWNCLWLLNMSVAREINFSETSALALRNACDRLDGRGLKAQAAKQAIRKLVRVLWAVWRSARANDIERWTANNFFKSKFGIQKLTRIGLPKVSNDLRRIGRQLARDGRV